MDWLNSVKSKYRVVAAKKWSADVKTKWEPPAGLFTKTSAEIFNSLKRAPGGLKKAGQRLSFYINRAGKNLDAKERKRLEKILDKIKKTKEAA